jgi:hypothetical protein
MKANIEIDFKKINYFKVNAELLKKSPQLPETTKKVLDILCGNLKKYFEEKGIEVKINYELITDE